MIKTVGRLWLAATLIVAASAALLLTDHQRRAARRGAEHRDRAVLAGSFDCAVSERFTGSGRGGGQRGAGRAGGGRFR